MAMTEQEQRKELEGRIYVLEEFIRYVVRPQVPPHAKDLPPEIHTFLLNMDQRLRLFDSVSPDDPALPDLFKGRTEAVFMGAEIARDFLLNLFHSPRE